MMETAATTEQTSETPANGQRTAGPIDAGPFVFNSIHDMICDSPPREGESVWKVVPKAWIDTTSKLPQPAMVFVRAKNFKQACERAMNISKVPHKEVYDAGMAFRHKQLAEQRNAERTA